MLSNTPDSVAQWLRTQFEACAPGDAKRQTLEALANNECMELLWREGVASWPATAQIWLIENAFYLATEPIKSALTRPAEWRLALGQPYYRFATRAIFLIEALETYHDDAVNLYAALDELDNYLRIFAALARSKAEELRSTFDHLTPPDPRGRGIQRQQAYELALDDALTKIPGVQPSQTQRDRIVALLTSVVFDIDVDPETLRRTRTRRRGKTRSR
jgi:hypothetical protein